MSVIISDDIVHATHMSETEITQEFAILLYQKSKLSLGQCVKLTGMHRVNFQHLLASRQIPINYDISDLEHDLKVLSNFSK